MDNGLHPFPWKNNNNNVQTYNEDNERTNEGTFKDLSFPFLSFSFLFFSFSLSPRLPEKKRIMIYDLNGRSRENERNGLGVKHEKEEEGEEERRGGGGGEGRKAE